MAYLDHGVNVEVQSSLGARARRVDLNGVQDSLRLAH